MLPVAKSNGKDMKASNGVSHSFRTVSYIGNTCFLEKGNKPGRLLGTNYHAVQQGERQTAGFH